MALISVDIIPLNVFYYFYCEKMKRTFSRGSNQWNTNSKEPKWPHRLMWMWMCECMIALDPHGDSHNFVCNHQSTWFQFIVPFHINLYECVYVLTWRIWHKQNTMHLWTENSLSFAKLINLVYPKIVHVFFCSIQTVPKAAQAVYGAKLCTGTTHKRNILCLCNDSCEINRKQYNC